LGVAITCKLQGDQEYTMQIFAAFMTNSGKNRLLVSNTKKPQQQWRCGF